MTVVNANVPSTEDMASENSLKGKGLLMPFDKEEYNKNWNGIIPFRGKFPHSKTSRIVYCPYDAKDAKVRSGGSENNGVFKIAQALENIAARSSSGLSTVAQQHQKVVKFTRIYSPSLYDKVISNYEISCQITDLSKTLYSLLYDSEVAIVNDADRFWNRFWNFGELILANKGKTWDFDFIVQLKNNLNYHINLSQIKSLKVSEILSDPNIDLPLSITLHVIDIEVLTGSAWPK